MIQILSGRFKAKKKAEMTMKKSITFFIILGLLSTIFCRGIIPQGPIGNNISYIDNETKDQNKQQVEDGTLEFYSEGVAMRKPVQNGTQNESIRQKSDNQVWKSSGEDGRTNDYFLKHRLVHGTVMPKTVKHPNPIENVYMNAAIHLGTESLNVTKEKHEGYQNSRTTPTPTVSKKQNLYPPKFTQVFYLINTKPRPDGVIAKFEIKDPDNDPDVTNELSSEDANVEFNQESKTVFFKNGFRPTPNKMPYTFEVNATEIKDSVPTGLSTTVLVVVNYAEEQIFNNKIYEIRVPVPTSENEEVRNVTFNNPEGYDIGFEDGESTFRIVGNTIKAAKDITPEIASSFKNGVHYKSLIVKGKGGTVVSQQHATVLFYFEQEDPTDETTTEQFQSDPDSTTAEVTNSDIVSSGEVIIEDHTTEVPLLPKEENKNSTDHSSSDAAASFLTKSIIGLCAIVLACGCVLLAPCMCIVI